MGKFNIVTKERRGEIQARKRAIHGDPATKKMKLRVQRTPISGKHKRKVFKKCRREQKDNIKKGLVTMQDVEMAVSEGSSETSQITTAHKSEMKFPLKKSKTSRLRIRGLKKGRGKNKNGRFTKAEEDAIITMVVELQ